MTTIVYKLTNIQSGDVEYTAYLPDEKDEVVFIEPIALGHVPCYAFDRVMVELCELY